MASFHSGLRAPPDLPGLGWGPNECGGVLEFSGASSVVVPAPPLVRLGSTLDSNPGGGGDVDNLPRGRPAALPNLFCTKGQKVVASEKLTANSGFS